MSSHCDHEKGKKVQVYVDGKKDGEADAVDAKYGESDLPLVFMTHYFRYVKGALDEVVIFNKALSEGEISDLMKGNYLIEVTKKIICLINLIKLRI